MICNKEECNPSMMGFPSSKRTYCMPGPKVREIHNTTICRKFRIHREKMNEIFQMPDQKLNSSVHVFVPLESSFTTAVPINSYNAIFHFDHQYVNFQNHSLWPKLLSCMPCCKLHGQKAQMKTPSFYTSLASIMCKWKFTLRLQENPFIKGLFPPF